MASLPAADGIAEEAAAAPPGGTASFDWEAALAAPVPPCMKLLQDSVSQNKIIAGSEYATLATVTAEGYPTSRTIWVRELHRGRAILFTTDARTPKLLQLTQLRSSASASTAPLPAAELCWWQPIIKEQFRFTVHATVVTASHPSPVLQQVRRSVWATTPEWLQQTFANPTPGLRKGEDATAGGEGRSGGGTVSALFVAILLWPVRCDYLRLPITVIDNSRPLHRESRLKPQKAQQRWLHTRVTAEKWTVTELNP